MLPLMFWGFLNRMQREKIRMTSSQEISLHVHDVLQPGRLETEQRFGAPHRSWQEPHAANPGLHAESFLPGRTRSGDSGSLSLPAQDRLKCIHAATFRSVFLMLYEQT